MFRNVVDAVLKFFWSFFVQPRKEKNEQKKQWYRREVACDLCKGKGTVSYGSEHEFVERFHFVPDKIYECPYCRGSGVLIEEGYE